MEHLPYIETGRLSISALSYHDIPLIVKYASNPRISDYTLNLPHPYTEKDAIFWINLANQGCKNGTHFIFAIRSQSDNQFMGGIGLTVEQRFNRAEVGYWIAEPFWNQGYTTEATKAIVGFGFNTLKLHKLTSSHFEQNPASGKVMIKSGMYKEGVLKEHVCKKGIYYNLVVYGITHKDYIQNIQKFKP